MLKLGVDWEEYNGKQERLVFVGNLLNLSVRASLSFTGHSMTMN